MSKKHNGTVTDEELLALLHKTPDSELESLVKQIPEPAVPRLLELLEQHRSMPTSPLGQAQELDPGYKSRPHLEYLSSRLSAAVEDVENGISRKLAISMPPRSGKSATTTHYFATWLMRKHPNWKIGIISHEESFATSWARMVRRDFEGNSNLGVNIAPDTRAAADWETTAGGSMTARPIGGSIVGIGFRILIIDDVLKDFLEAHSKRSREIVWNQWTGSMFPRLEAPSLVVALATRWHRDDFIGRLLSDEYEGDPNDWEEINFPAIAESSSDVLGRTPGDPLMSPLMEETPEEATDRWDDIKKNVGSHAWAALYQGRPAPSEGAIFSPLWWKFWTSDPDKEEEDGSVVYLDLEDSKNTYSAKWLDSWDCSFKGKESSDFVVGQRWARIGPDRYLISQTRERLSFSQTLARIREWEQTQYSKFVHEKLVESAANGIAVIDTLQMEIPGLVTVNPLGGKEARARSITPEVESGHVFLPHPKDPGNEWVHDYLLEMTEVFSGAHDDQCDATSQALIRLREDGIGSISVPGVSQLTPGGQRTIGSRAMETRPIALQGRRRI